MDSHIGSVLKPSNSFEAAEDTPILPNFDTDDDFAIFAQFLANVNSRKAQTPWDQASNSDTPNFDAEAEFARFWENVKSQKAHTTKDRTSNSPKFRGNEDTKIPSRNCEGLACTA